MVPLRRAAAGAAQVVSRPFLLALLAIALLPGASRATPVLDQLASPDGGSFTQDPDLAGVQSFTVGITGHLTEIDLWVNSAPPDEGLGIDLSGQFAATPNLQSGIPDDGGFFPVITSAFVNSPVSGWNAFVLPTPIPVTAGQVLYFETSVANVVDWGTASYAGGSATFLCYPDGCHDPTQPANVVAPLDEGSVFIPTADFAFRTFVPEPAPGCLLATALVLGGGFGVLRGVGIGGGTGRTRLGGDLQEAGLQAKDQGR